MERRGLLFVLGVGGRGRKRVFSSGIGGGVMRGRDIKKLFSCSLDFFIYFLNEEREFQGKEAFIGGVGWRRGGEEGGPGKREVFLGRGRGIKRGMYIVLKNIFSNFLNFF